VTAGILAERDILFPFYAFSAVMTVSLVLAVAVGGARLQGRPMPASAAVAPAT
jgi:hypothetical protein